ncbi:LacI family DNA-binding transcriptional regulator [Phytohabitans sp. ZYX-F-186]|uniref:LacI family DNA-binding transcriptional regulator n=1 Tax=Phytohabitans maris TaxID=3071409 RepID=A0ABU0ZFD5_9ACTN|nr:LacI family DNA-binding transcriptional regulator [Phytohabitans sp. ZYX-F-186]MDQ7905773.1 LacI family DNA-binding transcriptional regulator [Phytohabitans sp. ZYX-F-186]
MKRSAPDRVRLIDVAAAAEVTKSIASRVLNGDPTVAVRPETRRRILQVARDLGYQPHAGARALANSRTMALALIAPSTDNPPYITIARGAYRRAGEHGYLALLAEDFEEQPAGRSLVDGGRVDGLLMGSAVPGHPLVAHLDRTSFPHVFVNRAVPGSNRNITMNVGRAGELAVEHLTGLGHRRIAHLAGPAEVEQSSDRLAALDRAIRDRGLPVIPPLFGDFTEATGFACAPALLAARPTAVFTSSPGQAIGVIRHLSDAGVRVPEEISVIAYGDFPSAGFTVPSITTIALPLLELGAAAVDELVAQLDGEPPRDLVIPDAPRLHPRQSTGPAPAAD